MIGSRLARYEITGHLGSGGMGDVYQATDLKLERGVAIKFLTDTFTNDGERLARLQREARVLASSAIRSAHGFTGDGTEQSPAILSDAYSVDARDISYVRAALAGYRLAELLNQRLP